VTGKLIICFILLVESFFLIFIHNKISLIPPLYIEVSVLNQGSARTCICMLGVTIFSPLYNFSIGLWNYSNRCGIFCLLVYLIFINVEFIWSNLQIGHFHLEGMAASATNNGHHLIAVKLMLKNQTTGACNDLTVMEKVWGIE
jgi:hypothetical protein